MESLTERFSDRVENDSSSGRRTADGVIATLRGKGSLSPDSVVADIGAGSGNFTRLLRERGARVIAIEPNAEMRSAAERLRVENPRFSRFEGHYTAGLISVSSTAS